MSADLKPCPMCGQEAIHFMHPEMPDSHIVGCVDGDCLAHQLAYDFTSRESASAAWNARAATTGAQIKRVVDRFLVWKFPENFSPDGGISFKRDFNENTPHPMKHEPRGTNLLDAAQATEMVRHLLEALPAPVSAPLDREGVARIIDPDGFARREQHLRVSAEWHEKAEKFAATENPAPYPDGRFAVERIVEAWRGVAEKHATYAETDVRHAYAKADAILALSQQDQVGLTTPAVLGEPSDGEEFLEFKEALSDLRRLRHEHDCLNGGGPGWTARNAAAWARADELFANDDEAAYDRQQEDAHG